MRFAFLAVALICGTTTVMAQGQKPASKQLLQRAAALSIPGQRNTGSNTQNVVVGGSDDCSTPDAINGEGQFAFNQTAATTGTEGQSETLCYAFGSSVIDSDVWFAWTAATTDTFFVEACTLTSTDTKIAAYAGNGCPTPGTAIACNDDSCGLQSQISFAATAGVVYTLQVGTYPGAAAGSGSINIYAAVATTNDDCSNADAISGVGTFPFNNQTATTGTEGQNEYSCYAFGSSAIDNDVWFSWTCPSNDTFQLETCNLTSTDTKIAVYSGSACPATGTVLVCNDDYCALQSQVIFTGTAGSTYMLQIGTFPGAAGGTGSFDMSVFQPLSNDDCSNPTAISGTGSFPFDLTTATTGIEGQAELICTFNGGTPIDFDVWFAWTSDFTGTARLSTCTGNQIDSKVAVYPGSACPTFGTSLACNDDVACPSCPFYPYTSQIDWNVTSGSTYMIQMGTFPASSTAGPGDFTIEQYTCDPACETCHPGAAFCPGDGVGTSCPCGNSSTNGGGCANGGGTGGILDAEGTASVSSDTLVLKSTDLLPNQPCLFFQGNNAVNSGNGNSFGDGLRCAGGGVVRLQVRFPDSNGDAQTNLSISARGGCSAGDLRRYQNWYRDPSLTPCGAGFNLTNGYEITWEA